MSLKFIVERVSIGVIEGICRALTSSKKDKPISIDLDLFTAFGDSHCSGLIGIKRAKISFLTE